MYLATLFIDQVGIFNLSLKLNFKKEPRPDNIQHEFLNQYAEWVAKYLLVNNKSPIPCSLPSEWKMAKVIPIHELVSEAYVSNFSPISLTHIPCKLLGLFLNILLLAL